MAPPNLARFPICHSQLSRHHCLGLHPSKSPRETAQYMKISPFSHLIPPLYTRYLDAHDGGPRGINVGLLGKS
jgi:hypothetical protein